MDNPIQVQQNNNNQRFENPFNLDPNGEDINIEKKLDRDIFCPFASLFAGFGENSRYYGMAYVEPLNESFFHIIEAAIFPNSTLLQISSILCYIIIVVFIIVLFFGLDETNLNILLPVRLSTVDSFGSFYPKKIKNNYLEYYRLLTFHFFHFNFTHLAYNILSLISFCSLFELLVKKRIFLLIFFLSEIITNLSAISIFKEDERFCGINTDINGTFGAFIMLFIMNWQETKIIFTPLGRFITLYLLIIYTFFNTLFYDRGSFGNILLHMTSLFIGALIFAIIAKPIKIEKWKSIVRIISGAVILIILPISMTSFYLKE